MSYDLYAFPLRPGEDPGEAYERLEQTDDSSVAALDTRAIAAALRTAVAELTSEGGNDVGAIELNAADLQVLVTGGSVAIGIPYSDSVHTDEPKVRLGRIADTMRRVGGLVLYDPQLEMVIASDDDLDDVIETYEDGAARTRGFAEEIE